MKIKRLLVFLLVILILVLLSVYYPKLTGNYISNSQNYQKESCFVSRVIDGDTLICNNQSTRLLGINTPEKKMPYYDEAKDFLKQIENKSVEILRDKEDVDKYDRKLRYVFYENRLLNSEILQEGLATSFMLEGLRYEDKFWVAESYAKDNEIKLWEKSNDECTNCIELLELNYTDEFFIIKNSCDFDCSLEGWSVKDDANHIFRLDILDSSESKGYKSKTNIWNDDGDRFFMRDETGKLVVFYEY
ncbi:MAG: thermonuclease family protein [Candidatus Nanoarchaeia archaeon]|nr:thermonuclease family protein [Candidatus Nanoarchaeia archaeon]MDD5740766.1 thermonuclease family protein [Candidatus Nanoarchaeia archaeon]